METAKPVFDRNKLSYEREERDGYYTFVSKRHPETRELIVNGTGKLILDMCDGTLSLDEIGAAVRERFPNVPAATIEQDLLKTVGAFSRVGIVSWNGENPFLTCQREPIDTHWSLAVGQEDAIAEILDFIARSGLFNAAVPPTPGVVRFASPEVQETDYSVVALRSKLFSYSEEFMLLYAGDKLAGLIGIAIPIGRSGVARLQIVCCPAERLAALLEYGLQIMPDLAVVKAAKIRLLATPEQTADGILIGALAANGFALEAELRNEMGHGLHATSFAREIPET